jgi:hypothetical protein
MSDVYESITKYYSVFYSGPAANTFESSSVTYYGAPVIDSLSVEISFVSEYSLLYAFGKSGNAITPVVSAEFIKLTPVQWVDVTGPEFWTTRTEYITNQGEPYYYDYSTWDGTKWISNNDSELWLDVVNINYFNDIKPSKIRITMIGGEVNELTLAMSDMSGANSAGSSSPYISGNEVGLDWSGTGKFETLDMYTTATAGPFSVTKIEVYY